MEMNEAFEAPVVETIGGKEITFPLLLIDDYLPWIADLTNQRRKKAVSLISPNANAGERFQQAQMAESIEVGFESVAALIWTVPGSKRVLVASLTKAGASQEDKAAVIAKIPPRRLHSLAAEVSGLFERKPAAVAASPAEITDPNASPPAPETESLAGGIGVGTGS